MTNTNRESAHEQDFAPVEAWDAIATRYDEHVAPGESAIAAQALELAGLKSGSRFLDVAAGPGGLALPAARLGAKVLATDWAPKMIECFQARVRSEGLSDAEGRVMDCHNLDVPSDSFDVTGSLFGVMLVPNQDEALKEMVRVTKPGGRVVVIAYGSPAEFEALHLFIGGLQAVMPDFHGLPDDPPPLEFQLADPEVMRRRMEAAGLTNVQVNTTVRETVELRSGRDLWNWCLGGNPIPGMLVSDLTPEQQLQAQKKMDDLIAKHANGRPHATVTAPLNIGIGTK